MKESILEKFEAEMELSGEELLNRDYFCLGIDYKTEPDELDEALFDTVDFFCKRYSYAEQTAEELINSIPARDAFYKMMEREGLL